MADWIGFKTPILFVHASKEDNRVAFKNLKWPKISTHINLRLQKFMHNCMKFTLNFDTLKFQSFDAESMYYGIKIAHLFIFFKMLFIQELI